MKRHEIETLLHTAVEGYDAERAYQERDAWHSLKFRQVIELAAAGKTADGGRNGHLWTLSRATAVRFTYALEAIRPGLKRAGDFAAMYALVDKVGHVTQGVNTRRRSSVTVYDTAFALAANRGFKPLEVHLHASPGKAAALLGLHPDRGRSTLLHKQLPGALRTWEAWQVEDILCELWRLYKKAHQEATQPTG
ncbi:hypothetical protein ACFC58_27175 [Kitasatospora purpeofusca]|uniref:hypothetical protein n=1 Tax=Kitasatospora purpeofusca TaxID=67352 RepID=UPI0035DB350C